MVFSMVKKPVNTLDEELSLDLRRNGTIYGSPAKNLIFCRVSQIFAWLNGRMIYSDWQWLNGRLIYSDWQWLNGRMIYSDWQWLNGRMIYWIYSVGISVGTSNLGPWSGHWFRGRFPWPCLIPRNKIIIAKLTYAISIENHEVSCVF